MAGDKLDNAAPTVYESTKEREITQADFDDDIEDPIDQREIFDMVRNINDPEHPLTLEQLKVTRLDHCYVDLEQERVAVEFTPTIPHCSMATLIGLSIRVKLLRSLPSRYKVDISIRPGTHMSETAVNRQLNDKERVAAALENSGLLEVVNQCLAVSLKA